MFKMYLQVIVTLSSFFGALLSMSYVGLTYMYVYQMAPVLAEKGQSIGYDWRFWAAGVSFFVFLAIFINCIFWVKRTQKRSKDKMQHFRSFKEKTDVHQ